MKPMTNTLFVCSLCRSSMPIEHSNQLSAGSYYINQLRTELEERSLQDQITIQPVRCMAACSQPCNVTLAAPGKLTFILSGLPPTESAPALAEFCEQYAQSHDGRVPYRERSSTIHETMAFILPPLPTTEAS